MKITFEKIRIYSLLALSELEIEAIRYGINETPKHLDEAEHLKSVRFYANLYLIKKEGSKS